MDWDPEEPGPSRRKDPANREKFQDQAGPSRYAYNARGDAGMDTWMREVQEEDDEEDHSDRDPLDRGDGAQGQYPTAAPTDAEEVEFDDDREHDGTDEYA